MLLLNVDGKGGTKEIWVGGALTGHQCDGFSINGKDIEDMLAFDVTGQLGLFLDQLSTRLRGGGGY